MKLPKSETMKPTAVIDMSVLEEICREPSLEIRENAWNYLVGRYQLVFPLILVEEAVSKWLKASGEPPSHLKELIGIVSRSWKLWLDDIHNITARELLEGHLPRSLPPASLEVVSTVLALERGTQDACLWLQNRKDEAKSLEVARRQSKQQAQQHLPKDQCEKLNEVALFSDVLVPFVHWLTSNPANGKRGVENMLVSLLRRRFPILGQQFDVAVDTFLSPRWMQFQLAACLLQARVAYLAAPLLVLQQPRFGKPGPFLEIHRNDRADEKYVTAAFLCQRLLTQDLGMARIMAAFEDGGFWKGKTVFLPKGQWLHEPNKHCV